jgi:hypothetical protein
MARRRSMYGRKRKINYGRIIFLVLLLAAAIVLVTFLFRKDKYIGVIDEVLQSDINGISGTISSVSDVDITVYSNKGIRYTNQHKDIKKLNSFGGTDAGGSDKSADVKKLFENLLKSKETVSVEDLPSKKDGYYWIDADFTVENQKLFFSDEEEYNFDLYYDIENKTVYIKKEYFNEFSTKNNKQKLQGYEATEEFVKTIEELSKKE